MWFDELMDDFKGALRIAHHHKEIFVPIFFNAAANLLFMIYLVAGIIFFFIRYRWDFGNLAGSIRSIISAALPITLVILAGYLVFIVLRVAIEAGSLNIYKTAAQDVQVKSFHFFEGIKKYFVRIFAITFIFHVLFIVLMPLILVVGFLYTCTIGVLTAGWGLILIAVLFGIYLNAWAIAVVSDDFGIYCGLKASIKLGNKYFCGLFVIVLAGLRVSQYLVSVFGPFFSIIVGWFIAGIISAYFKVLTLLVYKRKKEISGERTDEIQES